VFVHNLYDKLSTNLPLTFFFMSDGTFLSIQLWKKPQITLLLAPGYNLLVISIQFKSDQCLGFICSNLKKYNNILFIIIFNLY